MITVNEIIKKLDRFFERNDYKGAEGYLLSCINGSGDEKVSFFVYNELVGLYRKTGQKEKAFSAIKSAFGSAEKLRLKEDPALATAYINAATAYKAFGDAEKSIELFKMAKSIYEATLPETDARLGGLYNNMGLTLVDLGDFRRADELYGKALDIMKKAPEGGLEEAITYLNIASAREAELGLLDAAEEIEALLGKAYDLLDNTVSQNKGYYAFVCEKCAPTFGYYGHFAREKELLERARNIYEGA